MAIFELLTKKGCRKFFQMK